MRLILLGAPGAGKGTQAQHLKDTAKSSLIVMGDILREAIAKKTPIGLEAEKYVHKGALVPDKVVIEIATSRIDAKDCLENGFILDGFPRTCEQAQALDKKLLAQKKKLDRVIYYSISDEIAMERICGRLTCTKCKAIYHIVSSPPKKTGICDTCGSELGHRKDDSPEVIRERLKNYHHETEPLLQYYKKQNILLEIDAKCSEDVILKDTLKKLNLA